jgi:hypothetical protein
MLPFHLLSCLLGSADPHALSAGQPQLWEDLMILLG